MAPLRRAETNTLQKTEPNCNQRFFSLNEIVEKQEITLIYQNTESTGNTPNKESKENKDKTVKENDNKNEIDKNNNNENAYDYYLNTKESEKLRKKYSELYDDEEIPNRNRFLFVFKPDKLANQFLCGCSLRFGVRLISLIFLTASLAKFISVYEQENLRRTITSALILLVFIVAAFSIIYSSINLDPYFAYVGLLIYTVIFYFYIVDNLLFMAFVAFGVINPYGANFSWISIFLLDLLIIFSMIVHLYFVWICYSYWINLRDENYALVKGEFYNSYEEYDSLKNN